MNTTTNLVSRVYHSNWLNFYDWKVQDARESLASLRVSNSAKQEHSSISSDEEEDESFNDNSTSEGHITITKYSSFSSQTKTTLTAIAATAQSALEPHPNYNSTTPLRRSVLIGDDLDPMPFIPFSDDPSFPHESYMNEHYVTFSWHGMDSLDPDLEVICVQTVKDLMGERYNLTLENILSTEIMPRQLIQNIQLYVGARRRDYPNWPLSDPLHPTTVPYSPYYISTHLSPSQILTDMAQYFCISDCLHGYCNTHIYEPRPLPPPIPPTLSNENIYSSIIEPCSKHCFILGRHTQTLSYWTSDDLSILHTTLRYGPDTSPCDLSIIVRKPCNEVAAKRHQWSATQPPLTTTKQGLSRKNVSSTNNKFEFADFDFDTFKPTYPCTHSGPCTQSNQCPCALNDAHCTGFCLCTGAATTAPFLCPQKWRGCRCTNSKLTDKSTTYPNTTNKTCGTDRCPCFRARRECDPILCVKCESRNPLTNVCKNSSIQHMRHKRGIVHKSKWGLGYYLVEPAREGDLITEYVGDLIYDLTVRSRDIVAAHTNRQYMFKLNSLFTVDGTTTGNESRYINHASGQDANVRAHVRLVNSEHRIGIFACKNIDPGTELLLDYGSDFFNTHPTITTATPSIPKKTKLKPQHSKTQQRDGITSELPATLSPSFLHQTPSEQSIVIWPGNIQQQRVVVQSPTPLPRTTKTNAMTRSAAAVATGSSGSTGNNINRPTGIKTTMNRPHLTDLNLVEDPNEASDYGLSEASVEADDSD